MNTRRRPVTGRARAMVLALDQAILWFSRHWLACFNALAGLYVGLPLAAPVLASLGISGPARGIYFIYSHLCHQQPERSFFIFGRQMAFCQRDIAIYMGVFIAGLCYAVARQRWRPLSWWGIALMASPAIVDGSLQLFVPYESTWPLRVITGALAGVGAVWFLYPRFDRAFTQIGRQATMQLERANKTDKED